MSDSMANNTAAPRSTRAAALERRRAMSQGGKAALTQVKAAASAGSFVSATVILAPTLAPVETVATAIAQDAVSREGSGCGCKGKNAAEVAEREQAIEAVCAIADDESASVVGPIGSAVRKLCQERRRTLSSQGKTAVKSSGATPVRNNGVKSSVMNSLSGRDAARARREELCQQGRGDDPACRPTGRMRPKLAAPVKVEIGTTLRGASVSGTQVERSGKVTGNEPGTCRAITGTEYIGAEQYGELCSTMPEPAPAKISIGNTSRGQRVSGTEVDRDVKVTGGEQGACKSITGTEYLSADKFEFFCATKPVSAPAKVSVMQTPAGLGVTGADAGRSTKVTGDEVGACSKLTGGQYVQTNLPASMCGSGAPRKVSVMSTMKEGTVTGTEVGRSTKVTGNEYGGCQAVTGTEYIGSEQYTAFCDADRQAASRALMASRGAQASAAPSGANVDSGSKVTGAERGEGLVLSGTPYAGSHQRVSQRGMNSNPHPLARAPFDAPRQPVEVPSATRVQGDFSIDTPARSAQDKSLNRITGTAYGAIGRITGPVNLAAGLVSGTPEFRYRDEAVGTVSEAMGQLVEAARSRLTGDGREGGFAITGAAWRRNESVTGTEGASTRRNPTLRGGQRNVVMGAAQNKDRERPEIPASKITGSSGNDAKGSAITYSGGARG